MHRSDTLALWPARRASTTTLIIITIGISAVLRGGALLLWGVDPYPLPPFSAEPPIDLGSVVVTRQALWIIGITLLAVLLLWLFFNRTLIGRGLRACALNPTAARLMGVPLMPMSALAFALGAGLCSSCPTA
jgi:branched-chain amino acid transport system permease protein